MYLESTCGYMQIRPRRKMAEKMAITLSFTHRQTLPLGIFIHKYALEELTLFELYSPVIPSPGALSPLARQYIRLLIDNV